MDAADNGGQNGPNGQNQSLEDRLEQVAEKTIEQLENQPDDTVEAAKQRREAIEEFSEVVAEAENASRYINTETWISSVAASNRNVTKTEIKDNIDVKVEEERQSQSGRTPIDEWLEENIDRVVEIRSTDRKQDTIWRWEFGRVTIETEATSDGIEHLRFDNLRDAVYEATGEWTAKPTAGHRSGDEWKDFIVDFVERNVERQTTRGQRTISLDRMKDWVRQNNAYHDFRDVVNHGGMRVDEAAGELHIPNQHIKRWCDATEIATRAFQSELQSRGLLSDRIRGASEQTRIEIDGQYQTITYWVIDLDALDADPYDVIEEAETPAEKDAEDEDGEEDEEGGDDESGGEQTDQTGVIDSIGGNAGDNHE